MMLDASDLQANQPQYIPTAAYDAHQAPIAPPPRPPRPVKVPGHLLTIDSTAEAAQWMQTQVFYTKDRNRMQSIRQRHPIFLYDAEAQQVHGVYQRTLDAQLLIQDLTSPPGPQGYQVHVVPLYAFPVALDLEAVDDLLVQQPPQHQQQQGTHAANGNGASSAGSRVSFEPMLGSLQHGALWEAFMKKAKKQHKAMQSIDEDQQELEGLPQPPPPPPRAAAVAATANGSI